MILIVSIFRKVNIVTGGTRLKEEEIILNNTSNLIHSAAKRQRNGNVNIWDSH